MGGEQDPGGHGPREVERLGPVPPVAEERPPKPVAPRREGSFLARVGGAVTVDIAPLRRRDYRLLFIGQSASEAGSMLTFVAVPYQAYQLTGSSLAVGLFGLAELVPILLFAFVGGALADAFDRRRLMQIAETGAAAASALLLVNALLPQPRVSLLFVAAVLGAAFWAILRPALDSLAPRLVEPEQLPVIFALSAFRTNTAAIVGPSLAGVLIATAGVPVTYGIDVGSYAVSFLLLNVMRGVPPPADADRPSVRSVVEGLRYARSRTELLGTYFVDMVAMFFGMPEALFPAFAERLGGVHVLGFLYAAPSAGAILASLTSGWAKRVHRHGLAVIVAASVWGCGTVVFGAAPGLGLAITGLVIAGAADAISGLFRSTIWNQTIPDRIRGRLAGIEMISYSSGPLLGNVESGLVATLAGLRASAISGGVLCVVGVALTAVALPVFRRYDSRAPAPDAPPISA